MSENNKNPELEIEQFFPDNSPIEDLSGLGDPSQADESEKKGFFRGIRRSVTNNAERVGKLAANAGGNIAKQTGQVSKLVGNKTVATGKAIAQGGVIAGRQIVKTPKRLGDLIQLIENNPQLQNLAKNIKGLDFILPLLDKVDIVKAEEEVASLRRKFPDNKPREIANRIIAEKAMIAAGSGFASSMIPGSATLLFAGDIAANTALQAEMIYQIAACYELDLESPERKGEILTIFGLAFGGNYAAKMGLKAVSRNIPVAGSLIGASSNAVLMYSLGRLACQFYETQQNNPEESLEQVLEECQTENEVFSQKMIDQEVIMDELLVHIWLAGNPEKNLADLLITLSTLNIDSVLIEKLKGSESLTQLDELVDNLSEEYYSTILSKCKLIAEADGIITEAEQTIIDKLEKKFKQ